jgi:hypothetical protein
MKHLKKFNENDNNFNEDMIITCFSYVFDIAKSHEIFESSLEYEGNEYDCFSVDIEHNFWDVSDVSDFKNYLSIITEIDDAIEKLKQVYKVDIIQFSDNSNKLITINIANK